jgi:hypothetical protein
MTLPQEVVDKALLATRMSQPGRTRGTINCTREAHAFIYRERRNGEPVWGAVDQLVGELTEHRNEAGGRTSANPVNGGAFEADLSRDLQQAGRGPGDQAQGVPWRNRGAVSHPQAGDPRGRAPQGERLVGGCGAVLATTNATRARLARRQNECRELRAV